MRSTNQRTPQSTPRYHLAYRPTITSWWLDAPREAFTARAQREAPRMGAGRFGSITPTFNLARSPAPLPVRMPRIDDEEMTR